MRALAVLTLLLSVPASAQRIVQSAEETAPFHFDEVHGLAENGALFAYGRQLSGTASGLRVDATSVHVEPGLAAATVSSIGVADAIACGGRRWLLEYDGAHVRFRARPSDGAEAWGRAFDRDRFPTIRIRCAGSRPIVGWVDRGEMVTVALEPNAERRTRVWPADEHADFEWIARTPDEIYVLARVSQIDRPARLMHLSSGRIAHERDLGPALPGALALTGDRVHVSTASPDGRAIALQSFASADLAPGPRASIAMTHSAACIALWATPTAMIAGVVEHWSGPDMAALPSTGTSDRPPRSEPRVHRQAWLYAWSPNDARVGPAFSLDARELGAGAVVGGRLVIVQPVESAGVIHGEVQLRPTRIRRFAIEP